MSAQDTYDDADLSSTNVDAKLDRYKESKSKSSSKSKDVSHVPCKFFRVGSCTAGSSCPFSHQIQQPGQQKDVCAWFIKGNCKFGHKCALAHILPGQSPAMDRRNKKAAQIAAAGSANNTSSPGGGGAPKDRDRDRDHEHEREHERSGDSNSRNRKSTGSSSGQSSGRGGPSSRSNTLLSGSTAPTRMLSAGARPPLPISISKAAPAPAETAPALRDADFTSRDTLPKDDDHGQPHNGVNVQQPQQSHEGDASRENAGPNTNVITNAANGAGIAIGLASPPPNPTVTSPFPVSTPPRPHRFALRHASSPSVDFGPVGSPPRASPSAHHHHHHHSNSSNPIRINGFSPGTSPRDPVQGTQPLAAPTADPSFSAPPGTTLFPNPSSPRGTTGGSGLAASLSLGVATGAQSPPHIHAQPFAVGSLPVLSRPIPESTSYAETFDEEDMEELVPSSLKDLLSPEEQSRRMSRTSSSHTGGLGVGGPGSGAGSGGTGGIPTAVQRSGVQREDTRHRHSRSVPSASILSQNLRSIWSDAPGELSGQDANAGFGGLSPPTGAGVLGSSPSFTSSPRLHAFDKDGPSPSMLSPSNASAAFLGLHHYMGSGHPSRVPGGISAVRAVSQGNIHHHSGLTSTANPPGLNALPSASSSFDGRAHIHPHGLSSSPHSHSQFVARAPGTTSVSAYDVFSSSPSKYSSTLSSHHVGIGSGVGGLPVPNTAGAIPSAGGVGSGGGPFRAEQALSPASRALQAHIPGQSLPQGLAAGFSRIHLQPATSPGVAFSPGSASIPGSFLGNGGGLDDGAGTGTDGGMEWMSTTPTNNTHAAANNGIHAVAGASGTPDYTFGPGSNTTPSLPVSNTTTSLGNATDNTTSTSTDVGGLTSMFSHISYSSVAAGGLRGHTSPTAVSSIPTSMSRRSSARGGSGVGSSGWGPAGVGVGGVGVHPHPLSSPLSGPVLTNDDDELFSMDEEK